MQTKCKYNIYLGNVVFPLSDENSIQQTRPGARGPTVQSVGAGQAGAGLLNSDDGTMISAAELIIIAAYRSILAGDVTSTVLVPSAGQGLVW